MGFISYTTCSVVAGIYLANRALYRFFFNPLRHIVPISEMFVQYKRKLPLRERLFKKFLKKPQTSELYEFKCNIDEDGQVDSPITLKWDPMFSYLDQNKSAWGFDCSAIYNKKLNRIDVLNLKQLVNYQQKSFESTKLRKVDPNTMREFVKCLIQSNTQAIGSYGDKTYLEFYYKLLEAENQNYTDVSMKITHLEKINKEIKLIGLLKRRNNDDSDFKENLEIIEKSIVGYKYHSLYFFAMNNKGLLNIYTPYVNEDYASAYRLPFEVLLEKTTNLKVIQKVLTKEDIIKTIEEDRLLEILVLPKKWTLKKMQTVKLHEKTYQIDNKFKNDYFYNKIDSLMQDIKLQKIEADQFAQHYEEIYL